MLASLLGFLTLTSLSGSGQSVGRLQEFQLYSVSQVSRCGATALGTYADKGNPLKVPWRL